ncbi:hypothetical protein ACFX4N_24475 [Priestia sp. YIM B13551]|uniref:hypothetical protein n=1 Tax=Priestia sp. YIM B13551 TaxID=3366306 RepID=UPI00366BD2CE
MAGIKNRYQLYGATPFESVKGTDILERHMNLQMREYTPYCRFCGGEIVDATQNEHGQTVDPEWERMVQAHTHCFRKQAQSF